MHSSDCSRCFRFKLLKDAKGMLAVCAENFFTKRILGEYDLEPDCVPTDDKCVRSAPASIWTRLARRT